MEAFRQNRIQPLPGRGPVSYTHLDVYKRQLFVQHLRWEARGWSGEAGFCEVLRCRGKYSTCGRAGYVIDMAWLRRCGRGRCRRGASHRVGKSIFGIVSFAALDRWVWLEPVRGGRPASASREGEPGRVWGRLAQAGAGWLANAPPGRLSAWSCPPMLEYVHRM